MNSRSLIFLISLVCVVFSLSSTSSRFGFLSLTHAVRKHMCNRSRCLIENFGNRMINITRNSHIAPTNVISNLVAVSTLLFRLRCAFDSVHFSSVYFTHGFFVCLSLFHFINAETFDRVLCKNYLELQNIWKSDYCSNRYNLLLLRFHYFESVFFCFVCRMIYIYKYISAKVKKNNEIHVLFRHSCAFDFGASALNFAIRGKFSVQWVHIVCMKFD